MNMEKQNLFKIALMTKYMSQSKIAEHLGVSRQRIGQLLNKAESLGMNVVRRHLKKSICQNCGIEHLGNNKFCSKECRAQSPRKFGGPASQIQVEIFTCDGCGVKFSRTRRLTYIREKMSERRGKKLKRVFCSQKCYRSRSSLNVEWSSK